MSHRILSTLGLWAALILIPTLLGNPGSIAILLIFAAGSLHELRALFSKTGAALAKIPLYTASAFALAISLYFHSSLMVVGIVFLIALISAQIFILLTEEIGKVVHSGAHFALALAMIPLPFALGGIILLQEGIITLVWIIAVAKFTDVGALLCGMYFGKHRMAPTISPKKTWEGLGGGILTAILISLLFVALFGNHLPVGLTYLVAAVAALPIALSGVLADLWESALKRSAKVKDSGDRIPGIGGFLDLTDSFIFAFPTGFIILSLLGACSA
jgi:phosphatidate cytidylyltransferase